MARLVSLVLIGLVLPSIYGTDYFVRLHGIKVPLLRYDFRRGYERFGGIPIRLFHILKSHRAAYRTLESGSKESSRSEIKPAPYNGSWRRYQDDSSRKSSGDIDRTGTESDTGYVKKKMPVVVRVIPNPNRYRTYHRRRNPASNRRNGYPRSDTTAKPSRNSKDRLNSKGSRLSEQLAKVHRRGHEYPESVEPAAEPEPEPNNRRKTTKVPNQYERTKYRNHKRRPKSKTIRLWTATPQKRVLAEPEPTPSISRTIASRKSQSVTASYTQRAARPQEPSKEKYEVNSKTVYEYQDEVPSIRNRAVPEPTPPISRSIGSKKLQLVTESYPQPAVEKASTKDRQDENDTTKRRQDPSRERNEDGYHDDDEDTPVSSIQNPIFEEIDYREKIDGEYIRPKVKDISVTSVRNLYTRRPTSRRHVGSFPSKSRTVGIHESKPTTQVPTQEPVKKSSKDGPGSKVQSIHENRPIDPKKENPRVGDSVSTTTDYPTYTENIPPYVPVFESKYEQRRR